MNKYFILFAFVVILSLIPFVSKEFMVIGEENPTERSLLKHLKVDKDYYFYFAKNTPKTSLRILKIEKDGWILVQNSLLTNAKEFWLNVNLTIAVSSDKISW